MPHVPKPPDPIAEVDPALADALRAWLVWYGTRKGSAEDPERRLADALRALDRDPEAGKKRRILAALVEAHNDREGAAKVLGISARTLAREMGRLDLWEKADLQADLYQFPRRAPGQARKPPNLKG